MPRIERAGAWLPGLDAQIEPRIPAPRAVQPLDGRIPVGWEAWPPKCSPQPPNRPWGERIGR